MTFAFSLISKITNATDLSQKQKLLAVLLKNKALIFLPTEKIWLDRTLEEMKTNMTDGVSSKNILENTL